MEKKMKEIAKHDKDTGSSEVQISILTAKIENLSEHIKKFKKDKHSSVGLIKAVNKRKKLLDYLKKNKMEAYKDVISKLNLRK
jgi:small subunit ribosomal protein S15|tara:strand:- start:115 stop:363 length:249 start_codon:yes stop_codon:yes gene_type:complete